jgi:hypothetical protein
MCQKRKHTANSHEPTVAWVASFQNHSGCTFEFGKRHFGLAPELKYPTFTLDNRDVTDENYFCMITLDEFDKQLMDQFKPLLHKDVCIDYKLAKFSFTPEDTLIQGVNVVLTKIRKYAGKKPLFDEYQQVSDDSHLSFSAMTEEDKKIHDATKARMEANEELFRSVDEIADTAAARATSTNTELNAEEKEIDDDVEAQMAERFNLPAIAPPKLVRQNAIDGHRRRRETPQ